MKICEDCGDECTKRLRCPLCKKLVCPWCRHHVHNAEMQVCELNFEYSGPGKWPEYKNG